MAYKDLDKRRAFDRKRYIKRKEYFKVYLKKYRKEYRKKHPYIRKPLPPEERFWLRVDKKEENKCWLWTGGIYQTGYGKFLKKYAHRFSYELNIGVIPKGMCVCHTCDNPPCVNPKHLWIGTMLDNMRDRDKKGRGRWANKKLRVGV